VLTRNSAEMLTAGSLNFMFTRKSVFTFDKTDEMDIEELELELIDAGLEEIEAEDGVVIITGDYTSFGTLTKALEEMEIEITKAHLERMANAPISLSEADQEEIDKILEKLEDDEDVQKVFTNIA